MHDLRESQAIAQYSDLVLLLHRDEDVTPHVVDVGVGKNRHGPKGSFELQWQGHYARMVAPDSPHWKGKPETPPGAADLQLPKVAR